MELVELRRVWITKCEIIDHEPANVCKYLEVVERIQKCPYISFDDKWLVTAWDEVQMLLV